MKSQGNDEQADGEVQGKDEQKHVNETRRQTKTCSRQSHGCRLLLLDFVHFGDQIVFGDLGVEVCGGQIDLGEDVAMTFIGAFSV
jgi:hypothetical protein